MGPSAGCRASTLLLTIVLSPKREGNKMMSPQAHRHTQNTNGRTLQGCFLLMGQGGFSVSCIEDPSTGVPREMLTVASP